MQKINYFELLEELSVLSARAVYLTSCKSRAQLQRSLTEISSIESKATLILNGLEEALFKDFLPPLERRSIAEAGHRLCKTIWSSAMILGQKSQRMGYDKSFKEYEVCVELSKLIEESVSMLKKIKKPNQTPKAEEFRKLLNSSRSASRLSSKKQSSTQNLFCELREELSDCFDGIIEIMLCNI
jgi:uncharacterized protein Yka (UPF0111/DUF47 family)